MMADRSVFISHSTDVERNLASVIRHGLTKHGLGVFPAIQESQAGDPRFVIKSASVWIVVCSKQYPESAACLNELLCMVQTQVTKIIPIFCDIEPWELRSVDDGAYARALQNHRDNGVTTEVVGEWRAALSQVSKICGVVFSTKKDDYGERLKQIVDIVLDAVGREQLCEGRYPVGLDQRAENFEKELSNRDIKVVGIVGPAGSGKSTLAARLFNTYSKFSRFKRRSFLSDVNKREVSSVQENLVKDLLLDRNLSIRDTRKGRTTLKHRLQDLPGVLIVFDGIEKQEQIDNLLFVKDIVGNDSLILVTSRDQSLLHNHGVKIHNVKLLDAAEAQELFCRYAFNQPRPVHNLQDMVEELVRMCDGLPLALKVLAEQLRHERDPSKWKQRLETLLRKQRPNKWWRGVWIDRMTAAFKALIFAATVIGFGCFLGKIKWLRFQMRGSKWNDRMKAVFSAIIRSINNALCYLKVQR